MGHLISSLARCEVPVLKAERAAAEGHEEHGEGRVPHQAHLPPPRVHVRLEAVGAALVVALAGQGGAEGGPRPELGARPAARLPRPVRGEHAMGACEEHLPFETAFRMFWPDGVCLSEART